MKQRMDSQDIGCIIAILAVIALCLFLAWYSTAPQLTGY